MRMAFSITDTTEKVNLRLKWLSICLNIDYENGTMEFFLNGKVLKLSKAVGHMERPHDHQSKALIVHVGRRMGKLSSIIGKIVDFNLWDR